MRPESTPRMLISQWLALLAAPVAWAGALGILFALTDETCARGDRGASWVVIAVAIGLALAPIPFAWSRGRRSNDAHRAADRACFLARVSLGLSVLFALVIIVTAVPIGLLGACRT